MFANHFCVVIHENGQLKLINHYKVGGEDQNSFTLLSACSHAGIAPNSLSLSIAGLATDQFNWFKFIEKYFAKTTIVMAPEAGIGLNLNKEFPHHTNAPYFIF
jgi:hypothetical protein